MVLKQHVPGQRVWLFGSITQRGKFHAQSDVDLALEALPPGASLYTLTALMEEAMGRPVDVVLLPESRLREKIVREGEAWIA